MAKPWEKFSREPRAGTAPEGPWKKFQAAKPAADTLPEGDLSWGEVASGAASNFLPSAGQFASDLVQPILHPLDTVQNLGDVAGGLAAKAGIGDMDQSKADAVGAFFADRYGGWENVKRTMAQDPVGFLSDVSTVLSAGGALAAKAGAVGGKVSAVGKAVNAVGNAVDPLTIAGKAIGGTVNVAGRLGAHGAGLLSGTGGDAIRGMVTAGQEGRVQALEQMRGTGSIDDLVDAAGYAVQQKTLERAATYQSDIAPVSRDATVLNFRDIDDAVIKAIDEMTFKGVAKDTRALDAITDMNREIASWKQRSAADFHTPMGLDALKQRLGETRDLYDRGTPARRAADEIYNATRNTIAQQAPDYDVAMRAYANNTDDINEARKVLSLRDSASKETAALKLLSVARNNVNTNFGGRVKVVDELAKVEPALPAMIYGRTMNSWEPRGISRLGSIGNLAAAPATAMTFGPGGLALQGAALAASSPRLVGETAYKVGQVRGALTPAQRRLLSRSLYQTGRVSDRSEKRGNASR